MHKFAIAAAALGLALAAQPAAAALIFDLEGGTAHAMPVANRFIQQSAPVEFGVDNFITYRGFTAAGTSLTSRFGVNTRYSFGGDRAWGGVPGTDPFIIAGIGDSIFSFTFDTPVSAMLAEFNWSPQDANNVFLRAYSSSGALLESHQLAFSDPTKADYDDGFFGISRTQGDIARIEIRGLNIGARSFETRIGEPAAVPEPATWAMMIMGFGLAGGVLRGRRRDAAVRPASV